MINYYNNALLLYVYHNNLLQMGIKKPCCPCKMVGYSKANRFMV